MNQIPFDRRIHAEIARGGPHEFPVVLFIPRPPGFGGRVYRDDIDGEAIVMCALPWLRFRAAGLGEQMVLPLGAAISLVEFEEGLRLTGFMGMFEILKQPTYLEGKFGVQRSHVPIYFQRHGLLHWLVDQSDRLAAKRGPPAACAAGEGGTRVKGEERSVPLRGGKPVRTGCPNLDLGFLDARMGSLEISREDY